MVPLLTTVTVPLTVVAAPPTPLAWAFGLFAANTVAAILEPEMPRSRETVEVPNWFRKMPSRLLTLGADQLTVLPSTLNTDVAPGPLTSAERLMPFAADPPLVTVLFVT